MTRERYNEIESYHQEFLKTYNNDDPGQQIELKTIEEYLDKSNYIFKD
jgi:hypothetical protein